MTNDLGLLLRRLHARYDSIKQITSSESGAVMRPPQGVEAERLSPDSGKWRAGLCVGMQSGCAWAQRGRDHTTWKHFGSLGEAEAYVASWSSHA